MRRICPIYDSRQTLLLQANTVTVLPFAAWRSPRWLPCGFFRIFLLLIHFRTKSPFAQLMLFIRCPQMFSMGRFFQRTSLGNKLLFSCLLSTVYWPVCSLSSEARQVRHSPAPQWAATECDKLNEYGTLVLMLTFLIVSSTARAGFDCQLDFFSLKILDKQPGSGWLLIQNIACHQ